MSGNLNNLALELSSPKTRSFAFYQQKASLLTGRSQGYVQKASKVYMNSFGISWPLVSYSSNVFSSEAMVTPGNTEEGPDDLEPAGERHIQKDTPVISCTVQV
jgi:hypothetical protein